MSDGAVIALVTIAGGVIAAAFTYLATQIARLNGRIVKLEHRDRLSWLYIRSLIDHAYRHNAVPLPEPPDGWLEDTE